MVFPLWSSIFFIVSLQLPKTYMLLFFLQHAEMADEIVQLKTLQTVLTILQSRLHPEDEVIISNDF